MLQAIIIIGPPGSGKTSCALALAQRLDWKIIDTDKEIEAQVGLTIAEIFRDEGEAHFRSLERKFLEDLIRTRGNKGESGVVIACGGGMPVAPGNLELLESMGPVVCLTASRTVLAHRLAGTTGRPLLASAEDDKELSARLDDLLKSRAGIYNRARYKVETSTLSAPQVADAVLSILGIKR